MVSLALHSNLEVAGSHRGNDRTPRRDDPRHRADDRRRDRKPDANWRDHRHSPGDRGSLVIPQRDFLKKWCGMPPALLKPKANSPSAEVLAFVMGSRRGPVTRRGLFA